MSNGTSSSYRQWLCAAGVLVVALAVVGELGKSVFSKRQTSIPAPRALSSGFGLCVGDQGGKPDPNFVGGVFLLGGRAGDWVGTYVDGDGFTGVSSTTEFTLRGDILYVPILGYPHGPDTRLELVIVDSERRIVQSLPYEGENPAELPGTWKINTKPWRNLTARLVLTDHATAARGWLGVAEPTYASREISWLQQIPRNYDDYARTVFVLLGLVFIPGVALRTWSRKAGGASLAFLPLPGILLLALGGLIIWVSGGAAQGGRVVFLIRGMWLGVTAALALGLALAWVRNGVPFSRSEGRVMAAYACVIVAALSFGVLPLEVAQEYDARSSAQARMVASPPDHELPYRTATYFFHGKSGRSDRAVYFGEDWSVASRGPLVPLAITSAFVALDAHPSDPPSALLDAWPATGGGFYVGRIFGILANALVVIGAACLGAALTGRVSNVLLTAICVTPVIAINTDFLWPKLFATYFILLALTSAVGRKPIAAGIWVALAYYSHPIGGLMGIPVGMFLAVRSLKGEASQDSSARSALTGFVVFCLSVGVSLAPWYAYKLWLGFPDVFMRYPFGDGNGFAPAASFASWIRCRWSNLWITLLPGGFYLSPFMPGWFKGVLSPILRWDVGYAKGIPGALGIPFYCLAVGMLWRGRTAALAGFRSLLIFAPFALMLLYWGYSLDGLGRTCIEPVSILLAVYAALCIKPDSKWAALVLTVSAVETALVRGLGVVYAPTFGSEPVTVETVTLSVISLVALFVPLYFVWARDRSTTRAGTA